MMSAARGDVVTTLFSWKHIRTQEGRKHRQARCEHPPGPTLHVAPLASRGGSRPTGRERRAGTACYGCKSMVSWFAGYYSVDSLFPVAD